MAVESRAEWRRRLMTLVAVAIAIECSSGDKIDPNFDTHVAHPAYPADGPLVLFDEGHNNWHTARGSYRPYVQLMESDGYRVGRSTGPFTPTGLESAATLIVANAVGKNERNDDPALTDAECDVVREWVRRGGALLLITDHYPTGRAIERLAVRFGTKLSKGQVEDSVH